MLPKLNWFPLKYMSLKVVLSVTDFLKFFMLTSQKRGTFEHTHIKIFTMLTQILLSLLTSPLCAGGSSFHCFWLAFVVLTYHINYARSTFESQISGKWTDIFPFSKGMLGFHKILSRSLNSFFWHSVPSTHCWCSCTALPTCQTVTSYLDFLSVWVCISGILCLLPSVVIRE